MSPIRSAVLALLLSGPVALGQTPPSPAQQAALVAPQPAATAGETEPNTALGRRLAAVGNAAGAAACAQCHALDGTADGSGAFPRLAGQPAAYLYKQLKDYASGARKNAIMGPIAQALSDGERQDVAAYYGALESPYFPAPTVEPNALQLGGLLSAIGSNERGIQACVNCHGPAAGGEAPAFPQLSGQYAAYTRLQLQMFQRGIRQNDIAAVMREIARKMSDREIGAVAAYLEAIRPQAEARAQGGPGVR
jgi:cytochrome c553